MLVVPTGEIAVTRAPSSTPLRASGVTVAACPTLSLFTSDSLKATVILIVPVLTICANAELEPEEDEEDVEVLAPPRPPVLAAEEPPLEDPEEEAPLLADVVAFVLEPAETPSPGVRLASEAIVPLIGAYSFVPLSAVWALFTFARELSTAACAEAMLAAEDVLVLEPFVPELLEPAVEEPPLVEEPDSALLS